MIHPGKVLVLGSVALVAACLHGTTVDLATAGDLSLTALDDTATYTNTGSELRTLTITPTVFVTNSCTISGNIRLVKAGAKGLGLSGDNSYTGGTDIQQGVLVVRSSTALGTGTVDVGSATQESEVRFATRDGVYANAIHVRASSRTYPAIGLYEGSATKTKGMQFTGAITADADLYLTDNATWTADYFTATGGQIAQGQSGYCGAVFTGDMTVAGTVELICRCYHRFRGKVTAALVRIGKDETTDANFRGSLRLENSNNAIGRLQCNYCSFLAVAENAFGGAVLDWNHTFASAAGETSRGYYNLQGHPQRVAAIAGTSPLPKKSRSCYVMNTSGSTDTTLTITGMPGLAEMASDAWFQTGRFKIVLDAPGTTFSLNQSTIRVNGMTGGLVANNGTLKVTGIACFPNVPYITVAENAAFALESATNQAFKLCSQVTLGTNATFTIGANATDVFPSGIRLDLSQGSVFTVPAGEVVPVSELWVNGVRHSGGAFAARAVAASLEAKPLDLLGGEGKIMVAPYVSGETVDDTWTNQGADEMLTTAGNWSEQSDEFTQPLVRATFTAPEVTSAQADVTGETWLSGFVFSLPEALNDFTFRTAGDAAAVCIGKDGIVFKPTADAHPQTVTFEPPVKFAIDQAWTLGTNTQVNLDGGIVSWAGVPNLTVECPDPAGSAVLKIGGESAFEGSLRATNVHLQVTGETLPFGTAIQIYGNNFANNTNGAYLTVAGTGCTFDSKIEFDIDGATAATCFVAGEGTTNYVNGAFGSVSCGYRVNRAVRHYFATNSYTRFAQSVGSNWTPLYFIGSGVVEFDKVLTSGSHVTLGDGATPITGIFHAQDNMGYCFVISDKARAIAHVENAFRPSKYEAKSFFVQLAGRAEVGAFNQKIFGLTSGGVLEGESGCQILLDYVDTATCGCAVQFTGAMDVTVNSGSYKFTGKSPAMGTLSVTNGVLELATGCTWSNATRVAAREAGTLKLTAADPVFDEEKVVLELADAGAKIDVAAGLTLRVADFYIDGVRQKPGYYDTAKDARLVGAGRIRVPGIGTMMIFR